MAVVRAPRVLTFGVAAIGEDRPNPLFGRQHIMENQAPNTAERDGVYVLADGTPVRVKAGEPIPLGAKLRGGIPDREETPRQRERRLIAEAAGDAAPEPTAAPDAGERARPAAPENRAKTAPKEA